MINFFKIYIQDIIRWLYWGPLHFLVQWIPRGASYRLVWLAGRCAYFVKKGTTARLRSWLERVNGQTVSANEVADVYVQYYRNSLDSLLYSSLSPKNIAVYTEYQGLDNLQQALKKGKGVILLHPHFGNEEYLMPAFGHKGFTVSQVASRWQPEYLTGRIFALSNRIRRYAWRMRISTRENLPVGFLYIDEGLRNIFRLLQRNEVLLLALDGREGVRWLEVPFLGMTAMISSGPMKIARSSGATVLPTTIVRTGLYRHTVHIGEPVALSRDEKNPKKELRRDTIAALQAVEPLLKQYPTQYAKFLLLNVQLFQEEKLGS